MLGSPTVLTVKALAFPPPSRIHRAVPVPLLTTGSGIATCPNRTIDMTGLVLDSCPYAPAGTQPCRLLPSPIILIPYGRISRVRLAAVANFPEEPSQTDRNLSTRMHTPLTRMVITSARHQSRFTSNRHCVRRYSLFLPTTHREPLCTSQVLPFPSCTF